MCSLVHLSGHGLQEKETRGQKKKQVFLKEGNRFVICNKFYSPLEGHSTVRSICKQLV